MGKDRCIYCFGPLEEGKELPEKDIQLATALVEYGAKEVILGGGEPTLAGNLEEVARILKEGGIHISLHTNGMLLTEEKLDRWKGLVDDIALPIDAADRNIQLQLRGEKFMPVFDHLEDWAEKINARGIKVGWHTVFTAINEDEIPNIYNMIRNEPFKYWRIYEYNNDMARGAFFEMKGLSNEEMIEKYRKIMALDNTGTAERGGTDCLLAQFLQMEERMNKLEDSRIQFVARMDERKAPYAFLNNNGQIDYYAWYSANSRKRLGNIFNDGYAKIERKWKRIYARWYLDEDDWLETTLDMPLWARLDDGFFLTEEREEVRPKYEQEMIRLANLWKARNEDTSNLFQPREEKIDQPG